MAYFQEIEGDAAILHMGGVFKQAPLFSLDGCLFAQASGGFVRLAMDGSTSKAKLRIVKLITDSKLFHDPHGRLAIVDGPGHKPLQEEKRQKLITNVAA